MPFALAGRPVLDWSSLSGCLELSLNHVFVSSANLCIATLGYLYAYSCSGYILLFFILEIGSCVCHTIPIFIMAYPCNKLWNFTQHVILFMHLIETFIPRPSLGEI